MTPRQQLLLIIGLLVLSILFWSSPVLYPVKLFVVLLHELSHALAALLTGGSVERITIDSRIGGMAVTRGGWLWVVVSSGYLGSMLLGGAIFLLSLRARMSVMLAAVTGVIVLLVTLLFVRNSFGVIFGIVFGGALLAAARWLSERWLRVRRHELSLRAGRCQAGSRHARRPRHRRQHLRRHDRHSRHRLGRALERAGPGRIHPHHAHRVADVGRS